MFGLFVGVLCLFGLFGMMRAAMWRRRMAWAGYGPGACGPMGHGPWGGHGHWAGHGPWTGAGPWGRGVGPGGRGRRGGPWMFTEEGFGRAGAEVIKRRLGVTEEQEDIVDNALADARKALAELAKELKDSRAALGDAFRAEAVDEAALAAAFARHDDALSRARRQVLSSLKQIHAVLTPEQRVAAADWLGAAEPKKGWL